MFEYLAQQVPPDSAQHATLSTALQQISLLGDPTIEIDWPALESIHFSRQAHFNYQYPTLPLGHAIHSILLTIDPRLTFTSHLDVTRISTIDAPHALRDIERIPQRQDVWSVTRAIRLLTPMAAPQ